MYRYNETGEIIRARDGACIPRDLHNADYAAIVEAGFEIAPFEPTDSPFEGLEQAEHDEWLIETAARRALAALKQGEPDEQAPQGREQDEAAGRAGSGDLGGSVADSGPDGGGSDPVRSVDAELDQARASDDGHLFSDTDDISEKQALEAALAQRDEELAFANERIAELEARGPEVRTVEVEKIVHVEVPVAAVEPETPEPYTPDFTLIPDALAKFALADETAAEFRARLKSLWQRFGIEDGKNFPGGGEPLTGEEKITMREIDIVLNSDEGANAGLLTWLLAEERA